MVDDDPDIRRLAELSLSRVGGFAVETAASGPDAIAVAVGDPPDAIVLDVMMPGLDGPATLAELRARSETQAVPVVMLTAKAQSDERRQLAELDISAVLTKPFDPMELPAELNRALGWT